MEVLAVARNHLRGLLLCSVELLHLVVGCLDRIFADAVRSYLLHEYLVVRLAAKRCIRYLVLRWRRTTDLAQLLLVQV